MNREKFEAVKRLILGSCKGGDNNGPAGRLQRFKFSVGRILNELPGNIAEIGGGTGESTLIFLQAARAAGTLVLVIDPWEEMYQGKKNVYDFDGFCKNIGYPCNNMIIERSDSHSESARIVVKNSTPLSFGFVDGDQHSGVNPIISDIQMFADFGCQVICLDDICRKQVSAAAKKFIEANGCYSHICYGGETHESYLLRLDGV